jgi:hypothetical protein
MMSPHMFLADYIMEYPFVFLLFIDFLIMTSLYTSRSSKELEAIVEKASALEKQAQEIQEQLLLLKESIKESKKLTDNLYNLHSARQFRNDMRKLYNNKARNQEVIRQHEAAQHSYKNAKNDFTEFVLTLS